VLDILGSHVAAGTTPVATTGATNVVTINVQASQAIAATDVTKIGLAAFKSTDFTVDANGFVALAGAGAAESLTGNSGGAVSPTANNINTVGTGSITIAGNPGTSTLTTQLTGLTNHAVQVGAGTATLTQVGPTATVGQVLQSAGLAADPAYSTATYPLTTTINQILYSSAANTVTGLAAANRAVYTSGATGIPVATALATDGQLIIGSTAGAPAAATLTAGTGISITNGSNSISIAVNGSTVGETITGNSGGALSPTAGNWNVLGASTAAGTTPVTTSGAVSTLTVNVQKAQAIAATDATKVGLANFNSTQFAVDANGFVSTSGTGILNTLTGNSGGAISPTAGNINTLGTGSITIAGAGSTLTTQLTGLTNHSLLVGAGTATITNLGVATNGQLPIGSAGADPVLATLTAGTGISITNGAGSISIAATGAGFTWSDTSGTVTASAENGYFITAACTSTLPASPSEGDTIKYIVDTASALTITAAGSQKIRVGNTISAAGGTSVNSQQGDAITLVYRTTGTTWFAEASPVGAWTTA